MDGEHLYSCTQYITYPKEVEMTFKEVYRNEAGTLSIDKDESIRVLLRTEILGIERTIAIPSEAVPALIKDLQR